MIWDARGPTVRSMPVEFLTDDEAAYGRFAGVPLREMPTSEPQPAGGRPRAGFPIRGAYPSSRAG